MLVIVTGAIGIGKSTVCQKLVEILRNRGYTCGGILTYKSADNDILIEDIQSGKKETLASSSGIYQGPRTAKYSFNPKGIDFGIQAIEEGTSAAFLVVDEVGYLELRGEGFVKILELIKTDKVGKCILVIRRELLPDFLPQLLSAASVFEATTDNRDQLPLDIGSVLLNDMVKKV